MTTFRPPPDRHWRPYGGALLPPPAEALDEPCLAFPSWFLKITCDRCGKDRMLNEVHAPHRQRNMPIRVLLAQMRQLRHRPTLPIMAMFSRHDYDPLHSMARCASSVAPQPGGGREKGRNSSAEQGG